MKHNKMRYAKFLKLQVLSYKERDREEDQVGLRRAETHLWCSEVSMLTSSMAARSDPD